MSDNSLGNFMMDVDSRGEIRFRLLFHLVQDLGIPPECIEKIERTLTSFSKEALVGSNQGKDTLSVTLHLLNKQKRLVDVSSTEPSSECTQSTQPSDLKMNAGWGYFLIERGETLAAGSSTATHHCIDLYLYKEGE